MSDFIPPKRRRPLGLWAVIACGLAVVAFLTLRSAGSKNAPLKNGGAPAAPAFPGEVMRVHSLPDYVQSLNAELSKGVDSESNTEAALRQILGPARIPAGIRDRYYELLGLPLPLDDGGDYFQSFTEFASRAHILRSASPDLDVAIAAPWHESDYPEIAEWLAQNQKHLDDAVAATNLSQMYVPLVYDDQSKQGALMLAKMLPACQQHRELADALRCRAMLCIGRGRPDDAWSDLQACHRLARHVSHGGTLIESRVALSIESSACEADRALAIHGHLTSESARAMADELSNFEPLPSLARHFEQGERYIFLHSVRALSQGVAKLEPYLRMQNSREIEGIERVVLSAVDWNEVMRIGNEFYDRFRDAASAKTASQRRAKARALEQEVQRMAGNINAMSIMAGKRQRAQTMAAILLRGLLPAASAALLSNDTAVAELDLSRLSFLLVAYQAEHGEFPESLKSLVPDYLNRVPVDPLTDKPYVYQRDGERVRLYSIGPNEHDEGGTTKQQAYGADDLVVELR